MPIGGFLCFHLATNASILDGPETFQSRVDLIHQPRPDHAVVLEWGYDLPADPLSRADRPDDRHRAASEMCCISLPRKLALYACSVDGRDRLGLHPLSRFSDARLVPLRLVDRARGETVRRRAVRSRSSHGHRSPTCCNRLDWSSPSMPSASLRRSIIWPTASGRWASPGAFGPRPTPNAGRISPAPCSASRCSSSAGAPVRFLTVQLPSRSPCQLLMIQGIVNAQLR